MNECYINNIKATEVSCPNFSRKYLTPFYNVEKVLKCKCGFSSKYLVKKKDIKIELLKARRDKIMKECAVSKKEFGKVK